MGVVFAGSTRGCTAWSRSRCSPQLAANPTARGGSCARPRPRRPSASARRHDPRRRTSQDGTPYLVMEYIAGQSLQQKIDAQRTAGGAGDPADRHADRLRPGRRPRPGAGPSRHQAGEHPAGERRRAGEDHRLWPGPRRGRCQSDAERTWWPARRSTCRPSRPAARPIDHRTDLFSLGSVLYAMCTGRPAFRADSALAVLRRVCEDTPRPIREVNPDIPDWLVSIIDKLLAKQPANRFQSAEEVGELLGRCLAHVQQPVQVPVPFAASTSPVRRPGGHRRRWLDGRRRAADRGCVLSGHRRGHGRHAMEPCSPAAGEPTRCAVVARHPAGGRRERAEGFAGPAATRHSAARVTDAQGRSSGHRRLLSKLVPGRRPGALHPPRRNGHRTVRPGQESRGR